MRVYYKSGYAPTGQILKSWLFGDNWCGVMTMSCLELTCIQIYQPNQHHDDGMKVLNLPLMPTEGAPAATACKAYSICTSFPEGLKMKGKHHRNIHKLLVFSCSMLILHCTFNSPKSWYGSFTIHWREEEQWVGKSKVNWNAYTVMDNTDFVYS